MKKMTAFALAFLVVGLCFPHISQAADNRPESVMLVIKNTKELSKFAGMIYAAGLEGELGGSGKSLTVFAPTNAAVDKIPDEVMKKAKADKAAMKSLVLHHTISGSAVFAGNIKGRRASPSAGNGEMIGFDGTGSDLMVGTAKIVTPDIYAKNGVVHVINAPLVPLSLDEKAAQKIEADRDAERKKMEEEMQERQAEMEKKRAKAEAAKPKEPVAEKTPEPTASKEAVAPAKEEPAAPAAAPAETKSAPVTATVKQPTPAKPEEKKGFLNKLFGN